MAKELTTNFEVRAKFVYQNTDELNQDRGFTFFFGDELANGTGADQADLLWSDRRTLVAAADNLDLAGILADIFGDTLTLVKVKGIIIRNRATLTGENLAVGGHPAAAFVNWVANATDILNIGPGGILSLWSPLDGYTVVAATGDMLKIDAGANTITYDIAIFGTSA